MHSKFKGTGNKFMDEFEKEIFKTEYKRRVKEARNTGHTTLMDSIYDPNTFILGTDHVNDFASVYKRNRSKTKQMQDETCHSIERENLRLLDRINKQ